MPCPCLLASMSGMAKPIARRILGLSWEEECSREAHRQAYRGFFGREPWPGMFENDAPSTTLPPPGWTPPPLQPWTFP